MIIEKSNGNGEIEVFLCGMDGYEGDITIIQDDTDVLNLSKHQAMELIDVLQKWIDGDEVE